MRPRAQWDWFPDHEKLWQVMRMFLRKHVKLISQVVDGEEHALDALTPQGHEDMEKVWHASDWQERL